MGFIEIISYDDVTEMRWNGGSFESEGQSDPSFVFMFGTIGIALAVPTHILSLHFLAHHEFTHFAVMEFAEISLFDDPCDETDIE